MLAALVLGGSIGFEPTNTAENKSKYSMLSASADLLLCKRRAGQGGV